MPNINCETLGKLIHEFLTILDFCIQNITLTPLGRVPILFVDTYDFSLWLP
jgi:hypothetical protein